MPKTHTHLKKGNGRIQSGKTLRKVVKNVYFTQEKRVFDV